MLVSKTISIDAMGGDFGPSVTVPAALRVLRRHPDLKLILVGLTEPLQALLAKQGADVADRCEIQLATEVVAMDESVSTALRSKKDSSMRVAIDLVKEGRAQACVSAGNTGALMATARFVLKTLPSIDRPAIMACLPAMNNKIVRVLDLGANVDSSPEHLLQFAIMGSIVAKALENNSNPTVALLNIGSEDIKGNEQVKNAAELLSQCETINYVGFVEGDDIFYAKADIVVCDGFVGNAVLKACEGTLKLIAAYAREEIKRHWWTKLSIIPAIPLLNNIKNRIDPRLRNGASLVGLNGIVIKSHGSADEISFSSAIEQAVLELEKNIPELIRTALTDPL
ncbi:MAG: phosphate acyltransferase PlsX [Gammaproteobacteria bacterium]|nr:phosphate acyltransferase PlsX [Gammaproteobacteria bacterium]